MTRSPFTPRVGMRYSFTYRPGPVEIPGKGWFPQKFAPGAFDSSIGKVIPLTWRGQVFGHGRLLSAEVVDGGDSVEFAYEVTDLDAGNESADSSST